MRKYRLVAKKGEGTFSEVLKAQNVKDGKYHAIKCMKNRFDTIDQVNNLREIQALRRLSPHDHIIMLEEVLYDQPTGRLALVFELMDANLYELIRGRRHYLNPQLIRSYMWQLMKALDHMHKKGIFHRDIKPENILIESSSDAAKGLKLADFGSCRGIYSKQPYTEYISTRWYRAPECLLTDGYYGPEMDMWGAGCVMFEISSLYPLFPGTNESDQILRIHKILGTPSHEILQKLKSKGASHISFDFPEQKGTSIAQLLPHVGVDGVDVIVKLLKYEASERMSAREAMRHPYFKDIRELEAKKSQATLVNNTTGNGTTTSTSVAAGGSSTLTTTGGGSQTVTTGGVSATTTGAEAGNGGSVMTASMNYQNPSLNSSMNSHSTNNNTTGKGNAGASSSTNAANPSGGNNGSFFPNPLKLLPSLLGSDDKNKNSVKGSTIPASNSSNWGMGNGGATNTNPNPFGNNHPNASNSSLATSSISVNTMNNDPIPSSGFPSSLPPIQGGGGGGGAMGLKIGGSSHSVAPSVASSVHTGGNNASISGNNNTNNSSGNNNNNNSMFTSPQKKKKKYRVSYGQRTGQNAEQVMRAYGVARNGGSTLDSSSKLLAPVDVKAVEPSKPNQQSAASGSNNYGSHPNRHYVLSKKP